MNIIAARLVQIVKNPIKSYIKVIPFGFGVTMVANFGRAALDSENASLKLEENPVPFTIMALTKSLWYGALWPSIPISIYYRTPYYTNLGFGFKELGQDVFDTCNQVVAETGNAALINEWEEITSSLGVPVKIVKLAPKNSWW